MQIAAYKFYEGKFRVAVDEGAGEKTGALIRLCPFLCFVSASAVTRSDFTTQARNLRDPLRRKVDSRYVFFSSF